MYNAIPNSRFTFTNIRVIFEHIQYWLIKLFPSKHTYGNTLWIPSFYSKPSRISNIIWLVLHNCSRLIKLYTLLNTFKRLSTQHTLPLTNKVTLYI